MNQCSKSLTGVEFNNLIFLFTAWGEARRDPVGTSSRFGLSAATVQRIAELSCEQIVTIVSGAGQISLIQVRADLDQLMDAPPSLLALLLASSAEFPSNGDRHGTSK